MEYTAEAVNEAIRGSQRLNEIKAEEIGPFLAMAAKQVNTRRYSPGQELASFTLITEADEPEGAMKIGTYSKSGFLTIRIVDGQKLDLEISPQMNGSGYFNIPREFVLPVRRSLPRLLQALHNLFPQIEKEVEFYRRVARKV